MKRSYVIQLISALFLFTISSLAQPKVWNLGISQTNIDLRGNPVVVGSINVDVPADGKVVVHFDGSCSPDLGDRIVLAASNSANWSPNDGVVSVFGTSDLPRASFSHSREYDVTAGTYTFYAVAQNYVDLGGSGIASIYANLTVEFFENSSASSLVGFQGISQTNIDLRGNPVVVGQVDVNVPSDGKVVVHFDGSCSPDLGDRIVLAASNSTNWSPNDGAVSVLRTAGVPRASFSHSREYDVTAGAYSFYAVAQNYVDLGGSGIASIYGSLTVQFFDNAPETGFAAFQGISPTNIDLRGNPVVVGQTDIDVPSDGIVIVHFDGSCSPDLGDRIVLAASNSPNWSPNDGAVSVLGTAGVPRASFSHTRGYAVSAGSYSFYAVAQNYVDLGGSGVASIYASLTAKFYPNNPVGVRETVNNPVKFSLEQNYPNPFNPTTAIKYSIPQSSKVTIKVFDVLGNEIQTLVNEEKSAGSYELNWNASNLSSGVYYYQMTAGNYISTRKMILLR